MNSALIRRAVLFGSSLMLCVSSGSGVALAEHPHGQPNNPVSRQYFERTPPGFKHHHKPTGGTTTRPQPHTTRKTSAGGGPSGGSGTTTRRHHGTGNLRNKRHSGAGTSTTAERGRTPQSNGRSTTLPNDGATHLTLAAATGSGGSGGGGMGLLLPVILAVVLATGSAAGIYRYRRTH